MPTVTCPHCQKAHDPPGLVTKETFDGRVKELSDAKNDALTKLTEAQKLASVAEKLAAKNEELTGQLGKVTANHAKELAFSDKGIKDPEVRDLFGSYFDRQAAGEKGEKEIGKWLETLTAKDAQVPSVLKPFLPTQAAGPGDKGKEGGAPTWGLPDPNKGARGVNGAPPPLSEDWIDSASDEDFLRALPALAQANPNMGINPAALPWAPKEQKA